VFGLLQTGQVTLTFVSGISAEGSVTLETLKVFMQFVQSWNLSIEVSLPRPAPIFLHVVIDGMTGYGAVGEAKPLYPLNGYVVRPFSYKFRSADSILNRT